VSMSMSKSMSVHLSVSMFLTDWSGVILLYQ
jgi:hypothetical protein